jgi:uncharacterized membrane-anchored protein
VPRPKNAGLVICWPVELHYRWHMSIKPWCIVVLALLATSQRAQAADPEPAAVEAPADAGEPGEPSPEEVAAILAQFDATLDYQQGEVQVAGGKATLQVPEAFRFLPAADAQRVLEGPWGNPPDADVLGMLVPADVSPIDPERGWGVVVTYEDIGHVDDADAAGIDYDDLLRQMQAAQTENNAQRREKGFSAVELRGWAEPPHYDAAARKLYWAMQVNFGGPDDTLNYAIRVLGREGVLELNAVAGMHQLAQIKPAMEQVVEFASFNPGNRYADYDEDTDKLATYGVGGLIAGGLVASKTGLLKGLWLALLAGKKFVVIGLVALGVGLKKLFGRSGDA